MTGLKNDKNVSLLCKDNARGDVRPRSTWVRNMKKKKSWTSPLGMSMCCIQAVVRGWIKRLKRWACS